MHPIDEAIEAMRARRQARTWPPVTLEEFNQLNRGQLQKLAVAMGINAGRNRQVLIAELYGEVHELNRGIQRGIG